MHGVSGCDQCVDPVGMVSGWWIYLIPRNAVYYFKNC